MTIRKELLLLLICSASLFSTYALADKPSNDAAERTQVETEHRIKTEHKATIKEHRALAEGQRLETSGEDSTDDDAVDAEEQQEQSEE